MSKPRFNIAAQVAALGADSLLPPAKTPRVNYRKILIAYMRAVEYSRSLQPIRFIPPKALTNAEWSAICAIEQEIKPNG
jgi:hypothetical protein